MKKVFNMMTLKAVTALILFAFLGGCTGFTTFIKNVESDILIATASIANPVTPTKLNKLERGLNVLAVGLNSWKKDCVDGVIPASCHAQIAAVQVYTLQVKPALIRLRAFVKNNDQVNAVMLFNDISSLIAEIKAGAAAGGQTISTGS